MKILIADSVSSRAVDIFKQQGFEVDINTGLKEEELISVIPDYDGLVVRSATKVTAGIITAADKLKVIGRAGSGVDNIDLTSATHKGIIVMNTPGANTTSTAEHTFAMLLAMARNIPQAYTSLKQGRWDRKKYRGVELRGKVLGIIGLGNIGKALALSAQAFDMKVISHDPFMTDEAALENHIRLVNVDTLFSESDFITVHTPLTKETKHLVNAATLKKCKPNVRILNCARGGIVDEQALVRAVDEGTVAGAALDVFEKEPPTPEDPLLKSERIIFTPNLGASTEEAQEIVAVLVAEQMSDALLKHGIRNAVNMPSIEEKEMDKLHDFIHLGEKLGSLQYQMAEGQMKEITINYQGDFKSIKTSMITISIIRGLLSKTSRFINDVNAISAASERGLRITENFSSKAGDYTNLISVCYVTSETKYKIEGTVFGKNDIRIVTIDGFRLNAVAEGYALIYTNDDRPGMIAGVSSTLAHNNINIASMFLARKTKGGVAMVLINTDSPLSKNAIKSIRSLDGIHEVKGINFS